ncbi:MAG: hypothetical protein KAR33_03000 [Candidatus Thorarchaeota archaeon]|nr:hypothetical protein [Candidatus Thorarchaeota archaeon]
MVGNGFVTLPNYTICGAASDSLLMVLMISGLVTFMVFVAGIVFGTKDESSEEGILRRKPLLVPSFVFIITLILVIALFPHPMAEYQGLNSTQMNFSGSDSTNFRIHDGIPYSNTIEIQASCNLEYDESLILQTDIYQNDTLIDTVTTVFNGTSLNPTVSREFVVTLPTGLIEVHVSSSQYHNDFPVSRTSWITIAISQHLASGFINEVMTWQTYTFLLTAGSFFLLVGGLCVGREDKKRIRREKYDQEPPREGEVYIRRA